MRQLYEAAPTEPVTSQPIGDNACHEISQRDAPCRMPFKMVPGATSNRAPIFASDQPRSLNVSASSFCARIGRAVASGRRVDGDGRSRSGVRCRTRRPARTRSDRAGSRRPRPRLAASAPAECPEPARMRQIAPLPDHRGSYGKPADQGLCDRGQVGTYSQNFRRDSCVGSDQWWLRGA